MQNHAPNRAPTQKGIPYRAVERWQSASSAQGRGAWRVRWQEEGSYIIHTEQWAKSSHGLTEKCLRKVRQPLWKNPTVRVLLSNEILHYDAHYYQVK